MLQYLWSNFDIKSLSQGYNDCGQGKGKDSRTLLQFGAKSISHGALVKFKPATFWLLNEAINPLNHHYLKCMGKLNKRMTRRKAVLFPWMLSQKGYSILVEHR